MGRFPTPTLSGYRVGVVRDGGQQWSPKVLSWVAGRRWLALNKMNPGLVLITSKDGHGNRLAFGSHLGQCVSGFIESPGNVDELEAVKLVVQLTYRLVIRGHFQVEADRLLHHLSHDEARITLNLHTSYTELKGYPQAIEQGFILCNIVRCREMDTNRVPHSDTRGR